MNAKRMLVMFLLIIFLGGSLFVTGCGGDDDAVVIGSKEFTSQLVLSQISILALEHHGIPTVDETGLGGTVVVREAQLAGDVDHYWEYTGTGLITHLGYDEVITDPEECYRVVKEDDLELNSLVWLDYSPHNDTYIILMRRADAEALGIETLSDLAAAINEGVEAPAPGQWVFGSNHEYSTRDDGYPGLQELYGFEFEDVSVMDTGITYTALRDEEVSAGLGFASDGRIKAFDLVILEDDLQFHPVYNAVPVIREDTLEQYPEIADILNPISHAMTDEKMQELCAEVDIEERLPVEVAEEWLREEGFID